MAENLWFLRQKRNMKVGDLSSKSGVPAKLIEAYEKGEPIKMSDLPRLARALYVDPSQIKTQSDPKGAPPKVVERPKPTTSPPVQPLKESPVQPEKVAPPAAKKKKGPHPHSPARPTQITHLVQLAKKLGEDEATLTTAVGKPLTELTVAEVREKLLQYTQTIQARKASGELPDEQLGALNYKRAYLPEGVDRFELVYLTARQEKGEMMTFKFVSGEVLNGRVIGFSPYNITIEQDDGQQITIQKLALAYYSVTPQEATHESV